MDNNEVETKDLLDLLSVRILNGRCEFILANESPADWRIRITQGGAKFFNHDGTDFTDGPHNLNIDAGQSYSFFSNDNSQCVVQVFLAITVNSPSDGDQTFTYTTERAPQGQCRLRAGVSLGKKNIVKHSDLQRPGVNQLLAFVDH